MPTVSVVELDELGNPIEGKEKTFQVDSGGIIFDSLDDQGEKLPHGCLAGSCGSCRILILEGEGNLARASLIEKNTITNIKKDYTADPQRKHLGDANIRLSCRTKVEGDIKIGSLKK